MENNCRGYIRMWDPFTQTGTIFGCDGPADGQNVPFLFANINDHGLQQTLAARAAFQLGNNCDPAAQPADTLFVSFFLDDTGFARNILPA